MKRSRSFVRLSILEFAILMLVIAGLIYASLEFTNHKQTWNLRSSELSQGISQIPEIKALRLIPDRAALESQSARALAQKIEQSATLTNIVPEQIASIEPQSPRRFGETAYLEHATVVTLENVTLGQLASLSIKLRQSDESLGQLHISSIRLNSPFQLEVMDGNDEVWNVEFVLTYFVYSPKSPNTPNS